MLGVINRAGADAPFATERTAGEFDSAGTSWLALVDPDLLRLAVDPSTGSIGAFALALPDYTRFLQATRGRVSLLDGARAVLSRMRFRQEAILVLQCTDPSQQRRGVGALIGRDLQAHLARRGYRRLRVPYVARDSTAARSQLERVGGVPLHGITFYRRALR
jgi:GNAT superfamily N-acetyltransferase